MELRWLPRRGTVIAYAMLCSQIPCFSGQNACQATCPPRDAAGNIVPSLCPGDDASNHLKGVDLSVCHPAGSGTVRLNDYYENSKGVDYVIVISNYYVGCNAGRREANVYSYVSTKIHAEYPNIIFLSSLKGGSADQCAYWSDQYERQGAAKLPDGFEVQPLTISDGESVLRDAFFTAPFPHPSYVVIDPNGIVKEKFVGPCCGREGYFDCSEALAMELNTTLHGMIQARLDSIAAVRGGNADCVLSDWAQWQECTCTQDGQGKRTRTRVVLQNAIGGGTCSALEEEGSCICDPIDCQVSLWDTWSTCSLLCGSGGERYRTRTTTVVPAFNGSSCPPLAELGSCPQNAPCLQQCVPSLGQQLRIVSLLDHDLDSPRDVKFTPKPGFHLGNVSSARRFSTTGEEAWVANGNRHSITIITGVGESEQQSLNRYDRGWYHYMINITALSFNNVANSGRDPSRDTYAYFATCQDNNNIYDGLKEPNFFQGPTLYDSSPEYKNLVRNDGGRCSDADECFFLHADMLHETPACPGIVHDPETRTAYGAVFWSIDGRLNQLVRSDFQQPHGPGLMDHSIASIRRYPEVGIKRGHPGLHQGMVIDSAQRMLYVSSAGAGEIIRIAVDTGKYARTAREEYPIFSSYLPSFEYSIYECVNWVVFANNLKGPSGLALKDSMLFVAEHDTGRIVVFDTATGFLVQSYETKGAGLMGLDFAPASGKLYGVNALRNELLEFSPEVECSDTYAPYTASGYNRPASLVDLPVACEPDATFPNASLFEQVHVGTGYASEDAAVQDDTMMDMSAALLANRTDCEPNSTLNFDALLLGGYFCHRCLPDNCASRDGGICTNIQWNGYTCDNEVSITQGEGQAPVLERGSLRFQQGRTYRILVNTPGSPMFVALSNGTAITDPVDIGTLKVFVDDPSSFWIRSATTSLFEIDVVPTPSPTPAPTTTSPTHKPTPEPTLDPASALAPGPAATPSASPPGNGSAPPTPGITPIVEGNGSTTRAALHSGVASLAAGCKPAPLIFLLAIGLGVCLSERRQARQDAA